MRPPVLKPGPPPDESNLRQAALAHLARFNTTQAGLLRLLSRRVERWAHRSGAEAAETAAGLQAAQTVVARLAAIGAVNDAAFVEARTRSLHRAGRSRRAISAHLQGKGVPQELAALQDDPVADLAAAVLYASRRRMGPFGPATDPAQRPRELARLARAGFTAAVANRVLGLPPDEAEAMLLAARQG